jgi:hypothetical protein
VRQRTEKDSAEDLFSRKCCSRLARFHFTIWNRLLGQKLSLGCRIQAPGCLKENDGFLEIGESGQMHLRMPPNC